MNNLIGSLCKHAQSMNLGVGVIIYEFIPPFEKNKLHQSQRHKKAYKVHWLMHPDLDVPPILAEHLTAMDGTLLG